MNGVQPYFYLVSYLLFFANFIFALSFSQFIKTCKTLRRLFRTILIVNIFLVILACIAYFTPWRDSFWQVTFVTQGLDKFPRLKLLTYEPSYYSLLLVPLVMYYSLKLLFFDIPNPWLIAFLIVVPLALAFSLGILLGIPLALFLLFILKINLFLKRKSLRRYIILTFLFLVAGVVILLIFYPDNPLFRRINNLVKGSDSSFKGRTFDSYYLAWEVVKQKSIAFGVGLGQIKVLGLELWRKFYLQDFAANEIAIPNAVAETFAIFGATGVFIRLAIQVYFYFKTKVYNNYYRLALFLFIFIYQFTGSYLFNIAEFTIWILAFNNTFTEFDKENLNPRRLVQKFFPGRENLSQELQNPSDKTGSSE